MKFDKKNMYIGQIVYGRKSGNAARYTKPGNIEDYIVLGTVSALGRKYFTVKGFSYSSSETEFEYENGIEKTNYSPCYYPYLTKEEIYEEFDRKKYLKAISDFVQYSKCDKNFETKHLKYFYDKIVEFENKKEGN